MALEGKKARRLRVLGYHEVPDAEQLRRQLAYVADRFRVLSLDEAVAFLNGDLEVTRRPVWITFDDGDPSIVENGLEVLAEFSAPATMFVCPALVDTRMPFWWQTVLLGADAGISIDGQQITPELVPRLKRVPDPERRNIIAQLERAIEDAVGVPPRHEQITAEQLGRWVDAGHSVGNHTWDHPLLDMCSDADQEQQIVAAHDRLTELIGSAPSVFAYPNGNATPLSEKLLGELGYSLGVLFDHRVSEGDPRFAVSRLRVNSYDDMLTFKGRISGLHPFLHRLRRAAQ